MSAREGQHIICSSPPCEERCQTMPKVRVRVYAGLREYAPEWSEVELPAGATLLLLYERLGIPGEAVKQSFVNGRLADPERALEDGDEVGIFPPLAGG